MILEFGLLKKFGGRKIKEKEADPTPMIRKFQIKTKNLKTLKTKQKFGKKYNTDA